MSIEKPGGTPGRDPAKGTTPMPVANQDFWAGGPYAGIGA
jgi:hypothetical protein